MRVTYFDWDDDNEEHVAAHGVDPSEAEEVVRRKPLENEGRGAVRLAWGTTVFGRHLVVVFAPKGGGAIRVITARDMSRRERRNGTGGGWVGDKTPEEV
jgi:uncharacterized DUF497 family protein